MNLLRAVCANNIPLPKGYDLLHRTMHLLAFLLIPFPCPCHITELLYTPPHCGVLPPPRPSFWCRPSFCLICKPPMKQFFLIPICFVILYLYLFYHILVCLSIYFYLFHTPSKADNAAHPSLLCSGVISSNLHPIIFSSSSFALLSLL